MTCGFTTDSYSAYNNASTQLMNAIQLPGNPLTKDSLEANVQYFAASAGSFCSEYENKNYLAHMNTPNVVQDLDLIRNLTGHEMFDFWGWSYGTIIGAMYAQMYPDKVGKVVLDGTPPNSPRS
jgi:pimeloyl-ACP methyl ester carboxylesterase